MKRNTHSGKRALMLAVALACAGGAQAQSSYFGLGAGESNYSLDQGVGGFGANRLDTVYRVEGGYYFNSNVGIGLEYNDFGKVSRAGGTTKAQGVSLSAVGKLPLSESFNLLGKVGTTWGNTNTTADPTSGIVAGDATDFGLSYGLGAEFLVNRDWSALLEFESHNLKFAGDRFDRLATAVIGVRYRY